MFDYTPFVGVCFFLQCYCLFRSSNAFEFDSSLMSVDDGVKSLSYAAINYSFLILDYNICGL